MTLLSATTRSVALTLTAASYRSPLVTHDRIPLCAGMYGQRNHRHPLLGSVFIVQTQLIMELVSLLDHLLLVMVNRTLSSIIIINFIRWATRHFRPAIQSSFLCVSCLNQTLLKVLGSAFNWVTH